ncbi:MAG TPA: prepilin-type N-terminal cleavage/methylation domain-containing protein [Vicinamibacteria bacterium]|nr:prepilin-type N-terminal cleavage/methylation domain-containing protein [Vicinamibacteria bacterium]
MSKNVCRNRKGREKQAGFTLIEALIAMIILLVGLIAIANLFVVAMSSNQIGNYTTVTTSIASDVMEKLKAAPFLSLTLYSKTAYDPTQPWFEDDWAETTTNWATTTLTPCDSTVATKEGCTTAVPGIGTVRTRWKVIDPQAGGTLTRFILVRSEVLGLLGRGTRSQFTTFRVCISTGCP